VSSRAPARPSPFASARGLLRRWPLGLAAISALGVVAVPYALVAHGTERAKACVASIEAPRGAELPDCRSEMRWFVLPSRVPWTANAARYRAEELTTRSTVARYTDAALGRPDADALARAADGVVSAEKVIAGGSQRVALEELGRAEGAPDLGRSAMLLGDRRTLVARAEQWGHWSVRQRALEAALLDGDPERAVKIAGRYAEFDPRDEELRVAVAAVLCLGGQEKQGLELFTIVQSDRASQRHEAWTRNWGSVRAAMVACAARAKVPAPPRPERLDGGAGDLPEVRAVLHLRAMSLEGDTPARREAAFDVIQMLRNSAFPTGGRVQVLAALLASGHPIDPHLAAELAAPHLSDGEPPTRLPSPLELTAVEWLDPGLTIRPAPAPDGLVYAAGKLHAWVAATLTGDDALTAEERGVLEQAATVMTFDAARALARAGDAPGAALALQAQGRSPSKEELDLARSSAWYLAGDASRALRELGDADGAEPDVRAVRLLQRAELLASLGKRDEAARAALTADEAAAALGERRIDVRAQWTRAALAGEGKALRSPAPPPLPGERAWPWIGPMATPLTWLAPDAESRSSLLQTLAFWDGARRAPAGERRAVRYAAVELHAGDAPRARAPYWLLAGGLVGSGDGDVEIWLDAFSAAQPRMMGMRGYAWARAEAARWRGDDAAAKRWSATYKALVKLVAAPGDAELAAALGI
jgi:hypothetical protein